MANPTLKIDIIVDDHGAVSHLAAVEEALKANQAAATNFGTVWNNSLKTADAGFQQLQDRLRTPPAGWGNVATQFKAVADSFSDIQKAVGAFALGSAVREAIQFTSHLADMSAKTGASVRDLQKLSLAGDLVGVSLDQVTSAIVQMQSRLADGNKPATDAVKKLGLDVGSLLAMDPGSAMNAIAEGMTKIGSQAEKALIVKDLFGKAGFGMLPMLTGELKNVGDAMERTGLLISEHAVAGGDALDDFYTLAVAGARKVLIEWMALDKLGHDIEMLGFAMNPSPGGPGVGPPKMFQGGIETPELNQKLVEQRLAEDNREWNKELEKKKREAEAWKRINDEMTGKSDADEAATAIAHLKDIGGKRGIDGGLTEMTAEAQEKLNKQLVAGMRYYKNLSDTAKAEMSKIITATMAGVAFTSGISPEQFAKMGQNMAPVDPQMLAYLMAPQIGVTNGLQGGLPGEQLANPTFQAVNPFRNAFEKLGQDLPDIIFRTIQGGGSVVGAVGAAVGAQFSKGFQGSLEAVGGDVSKMSGGNKALGVAGASIGAAFTGFSLGQQLGKGKGAMAGAAAGALAGSVVPGIGTAIGAGVGALAGFFGGRSADKKAAQEMIQQREEWIKSMGGMEKLKQTAADLGVNIDKAFSTKKPEEFRKTVESLNAAMEKQKNLTEGINAITAGTNARAANVTGQGDLNVVGAGAVASFGLQLGTGTSAVDALNALNPAIVAMRDALAGGNFQMSEAGNKLLGLAAIVEAERVPFQNLAADGQILQGMMQGNIRDFDLFRAIATDIGTSLQGMIDRGVPTAQILTLAQPQLQALWEAQQKWHVEVDATTQGLLNQAVQQGTVGENMKSIQQQMLDATLGIRDAMVAIAVAMGALPSAAQNAANGMNAAFSTVQAPGDLTGAPMDTGTSGTTPFDNGGGSSWTDQSGLIYWGPGQGSGLNGTPNFATGGVVRARPGGTLVRVGEAGQDEAITPLNRRSRVGSGGGVTVVVNVEGSLVHQDDLDVVVAQAWSRAVRSNKSGSYTMAQAALGNA